MRFFNTAGPTNPKDHYCIPPLDRIEIDEIEMLIQQKKYFLLHAPRQTGKTTCMIALRDHINQSSSKLCSIYCNVESAQGARENVYRGIKSILAEMARQARMTLNDPFLYDTAFEILEKVGEDYALNEMMSLWCTKLQKPLVLMIDEIDSLVGDTLISVLRQIRSGYDRKPTHFPMSIILCGVRDIRDYRIHSDKEKAVITGGSAFNIKAESLHLGNFNIKEIITLIHQHETETGQSFQKNAVGALWKMTKGQPWLVNALCYEVCFKMKENRDRSRVITVEMIHQAKENLIQRRETHLDQLADKLRENRVKRVIAPLLSGGFHMEEIPDDDIMYVKDLGLISRKKGLEIANPIYAEIIPRQLTYSLQQTLPQETKWYVEQDGRLNMKKLLKAFQGFFREHSEHWLERFQYKEAGPQLLLQAFLQRIVNGGGRVEREYGQGRKRVDLLVLWPVSPLEGEQNTTNTLSPFSAVQKIVLELKIQYASLEKTISEGIEQMKPYMDISGAEDGHLIIFNRNPDVAWEKKLFCKKSEQHPDVLIWGM